MDLGLLFGILGTWVLIAWALLAGGNLAYYVDIPSMILVVGATFTSMFFSVPTRNLKNTFRIVRKLAFPAKVSVEQIISDMVRYAEQARRNGILSLESVTREINDPFLVRGLQLAIDGTDPALIEQVLNAEIDAIADRHDMGKYIFDSMAKYAPAFGMIGTLVGLVIMLQNMDDPSKIGPGMAVAILTTLYGAVIANSFALPMADRMAKRSAEELMVKTIILKGIMAIQSGDNPRVVEQKLRSFLPNRPGNNADQEAA
ncbi:MAG: motility protein A [Phycisphaerales bacterium]|nr:motility protein A [Phycisphaerales bacterium]